VDSLRRADRGHVPGLTRPRPKRGLSNNGTAIAQPVSARPDLLQQVLKDREGWSSFIHGKVRAGLAGQPLGDDSSPHGWSPDLPEVDDVSTRARGWALSAPGVQAGRKVVLPESSLSSPADFEGRLLDLEIGEDGGLRLFCGRASAELGSSYSGRDATESVFESLILGLTKRLVLIAAVVAETADYLGQWDLGIAVTGLRGLVSWRRVQAGEIWGPSPSPRTTTARPFGSPTSVWSRNRTRSWKISPAGSTGPSAARRPFHTPLITFSGNSRG
jgi:hypothetical protein